MYKKRKEYQSITALTIRVLFPFPLKATSIELADTIYNSTIWNVDTVKVTSDLYLPPYDTLTIEPGTRVVFQGHYLFTDDGRIIANGTPLDPIVFTINDTTGFSAVSTYPGSWEGLNIIRDPYSEFSYCIFEYNKTFYPFNGTVTMINDNSMSYCTVRNCFSNVAAVKSMDLSHFPYDTITHNYCAGISVTNVNHCTLTNNNGDGIVPFLSWAYYWQDVLSNEIKNNETLQNAKDSMLSLPDISSTDTGIYYCIANDGCSRDTSRLIFELPAGMDGNQYFRIQGNELLADTFFKYNTKNSYIVWIRTIDNGPGNLEFEKNFTITILQSTTLDIDQPLSDGSVTVFPNLFNKYTTIRLDNRNSVIQTLRMINMEGKIVLDIININNNRYTLHKSTMKSGALFRYYTDQFRNI